KVINALQRFSECKYRTLLITHKEFLPDFFFDVIFDF
ncbi:MAG: hypothetical protein ACI9TK_000510, partial [Flavobacteriaceae bacterium]